MKKIILFLIIVLFLAFNSHATVPPEDWKGCPPVKEKIKEAEVILQVKLLRYINTKHDIEFNGKKYAVFAEYMVKKIWKGRKFFNKNDKVVIETYESDGVGHPPYVAGDYFLVFARPCTKKQDKSCVFRNQFQIVRDKNGYCPNRLWYRNYPHIIDSYIKNYQLDKINKEE